MAFALLGNPKQGFFDSSGSPLSSGTLAVLDPADDTNKASYPTASDADAATNANVNPVVLDSRGEPPNGLFGRDGEDYKLTLKDSSGTTVWTVDDVRVPIALPFLQTTAESNAGVTPSDVSYPEGDVRRYGATEGTGADSASAITTTFNFCRDSGLPMYMEGTYRIDSALTWTSTGAARDYVVVFFKDAVITKNFNGAGLTCAGGATYQAHYGHLTITKMLNAADGAGGGTPTGGDYGFVQNCRIRREGTLLIEKQQDDSYFIQADTNMNGSSQGLVRVTTCNGKGFGGTGTTDNVAVWTGRWEAGSCYEAGIEFADTFPARAWDMFWRAEDCAQDGSSDQVYTGGLNNSRITLYAEEVTSSTGVELNIPAATTRTYIYSVRVNTITHTSTSVVVHSGDILHLANDTADEGLVNGEALTNNAAKTITKTWGGSGSSTLVQRVVTGAGTLEYKVTGRTGGEVLGFLVKPDDGAVNLELDAVTVAQLSKTGSIHLKEKAAGDANSSGFGELWIKNTAPTQLWFTGDTGVDLGVAVSDGTTGGAASAGAGNQYVEIEINGTTYKVLHDGTV
jgi:hypothetical protein